MPFTQGSRLVITLLLLLASSSEVSQVPSGYSDSISQHSMILLNRQFRTVHYNLLSQQKTRSAAGFAYFAIAYKICKISDLHGIYALQFYFARYGSKLSDFWRERTRITEIRASLSSISALPRIANQ